MILNEFKTFESNNETILSVTNKTLFYLANVKIHTEFANACQ